MAALGIASSTTALIQSANAVIKYLKAVADAPDECHGLLTELQYLEISLRSVKRQIQTSNEGDLWLATLPQLDGPSKDLAKLLKRFEEGLKAESSWRKRIFRRLQWPFTKADIEGDLKKIERFKTLFMIAGQHDHLALSYDIKKTLGDVKVKVDEIHETQKTEKIAAWLTSLDYVAFQRDMLKKRFENTGQWFLESSAFINWVGSVGSPTLWCSGGPGVGKTILASVIVDHLRSQSMDREKTLVLSVFCDHQSAVEQTIENILRSLWKQLIQEHGLSPLIISLYDNKTPLLLDTLTKSFSQALSSFRRVYIILDALDEFPDNDGGREKLINALRKLGANTSLLVMTRDIFTIGSLFKTDIKLNIRAADKDISLYSASKLSCGRLARLVEGQDDLLQAIPGVVTAMADGMFYLGFLYMESLAQATSANILREELKRLPDSMANAYDTTMERINSQGVYEKDLAYRILAWVACAQRPLTVMELRHALAVEPGRKTLDTDNLCDEELFGTVCAGLVVMDWTYTEFGYLQGRGPIVRFVHSTTQKYFESRWKSDPFFRDFHCTIARTCLSYMSFTNLDLPGLYSRDIALLPFDLLTSPDVLSTKYPFLNYACSCWGYHARGAVQYSLEEEIITFLSDAQRREVADILRAAYRLRAFHAPRMMGPPSPLQFAVYEGWVHIMEVLLSLGADPHEEVPLLAAAEIGNLRMAELLLSREDIDVNQADPNRFYATPLMEAAGNGHEEVLKAILDSKRMNSLNSVDEDGCTALLHAIGRNHEGVVRILLATPGIDAALCNERGLSPLAEAAYYGHGGIVGMLLERDDVDPDIRTPLTQWSPLFYAAAGCHADIVQMLLQTGRVDVNSKDCMGFTALMIAVDEERTEAVKILLGHPGIDIMAKDQNGMTAYNHAYWLRAEEILALLEGHGAKPNAPDNYKPTYLMTSYLPNEFKVHLSTSR